jgi:hypothetical protein
MGVLQFAYLAVVTTGQLNPVLVGLLSLQISNGVNSLSNKSPLSDSNNNITLKGSLIYSSFLDNINYSLAFIFIPLILALILSLLSKLP